MQIKSAGSYYLPDYVIQAGKIELTEPHKDIIDYLFQWPYTLATQFGSKRAWQLGHIRMILHCSFVCRTNEV